MKFLYCKIKTSWGCIQALFVILITISVVTAPGGAFDLDLLKGLNLHANVSQYEDVSITQGIQQQLAYRLQGINRKLVLPNKIYHRAADLIRRNSDFTFSAVLRQEESNPGTIISFSNGYNRYLELQSSGRRNEIRFHYSYVTANNELMVHMETFPYRLADNNWHKIALTVSGTEIQLLVDCNPLYKRVTHFVPDRNFSASNMQLLVGQRNLNSHSLFKGDLQDVHIIAGPYGYLSQCEQMDSNCPTCGQFLQLQSFIIELRLNLVDLSQKLEKTTKKIERLEQCDCKKSCSVNGTVKDDGEKWDIGCQECKCRRGDVTCSQRECGKVECKHPIYEDGACCPKCLKNCYISKKDFEHGEKQIMGTKSCSCNDGTMNCELLVCANLTCPEEKQISVPDEYCKYCRDADYCSKGHTCHVNAYCVNLTTKYGCICGKGFKGDGFNCSDIDECIEQGDLNGNHCHSNTRCVNTFGSYVCDCLTGYSRVDKFNCIEIDECATNQHLCHPNADCFNTQGSYQCRCKAGFSGDGYNCTPVCDQTCVNGGECLSPGSCRCRVGYVGASCEKDLNECQTNYHGCKNTSICVNMPGWYYCKCKPGYEIKDNDCNDINECYEKTHSCHASANCVNTDGHFECVCDKETNNNNYNSLKAFSNENGEECKLSCMFESTEISDGAKISPRNQPCKLCTCSRGVITCVEPPCDCSKWKRGSNRDLCCPQCDLKESCAHQELKDVTFRSGEQWIYQCQTCECLYGEFDCWKLECPPLLCDSPLPLTPGDCCRRCPGDVCGLGNSTNTMGKPCFYEKNSYPSDQSLHLPSKDCATCSCKEHQISCHFDVNNFTSDEPGDIQKTISNISRQYYTTTSHSRTARAKSRTDLTTKATSRKPANDSASSKLKLYKLSSSFKSNAHMQQPSSTSLKFTNNNNSNNSFHKPSKKNHNFSNSHFNNSKNEYEIKNLKNKTNSGYSIPLSKISAYFSSTISKSSLISSNDKKIQIMKNLSTTSKSYNLNKININAQSSYQHSGELQIFNKSILQNMDESDTDENDELDELLFECRYERMIKMLKSFKMNLNCLKVIDEKRLQSLFKHIPEQEQVQYLTCINKWREHSYRMRLNSELNLEKIDDEPSQNDGNIPSTHPNLDMIFLETPLRSLLENSPKGKAIIDYYQVNQKLTESLQNNLADCILMFFLEQNLNLSHNDFELISNEITKLFPNEIKETFYLVEIGAVDNSNLIPRTSKLVWSYNNKIRAISQCFTTADTPIIHDHQSQQFENNTSIYKSLKFLHKNPFTRWDVIENHWRITSEFRMKSISNMTDKILVLKQWPLYSNNFGYTLVEIDFEYLYPGKSLNLINNWNSFMGKALPIFNKNLGNLELFKDLAKFDLEQQNSKCILIYQSLYAFLLGPTLLKSQKSNPSSNASTQFSITNPENQTRNLFFLFVNDITNLHATSEPHDDKSNFPKYESSAFPVIVSVGKSLKNIDNFYIVYKTIFFKFDNFLNALDVCFKLYHVLDLNYSIESYNVWLFIQTYFYEFDTISDKTYSTVTNLINQIKNGN